MNCKNCKNWVFGMCVVSNLVVGPDMLCNAWELSQSHDFVETAFATFSPDELQKRIAELEYKASDNASSIHAIISVLDVNDETHGYSDDMYDTALDLAHKLRTRVAELEAENAGLKERVAMLDVTAVSKSLGEMEYIEQVTKLRQLLTDLEAQLCWIPVSERLPELDQDVFAIVDGDIDRGHFYESFDGEIYFSSDTRGAMLVATHWMDIPDLPEEVQE